MRIRTELVWTMDLCETVCVLNSTSRLDEVDETVDKSRAGLLLLYEIRDVALMN